MRNLKNVTLNEYTFKGDPPSATAWDASSDTIICAYGPTLDKAFLELKRVQEDGDFQALTSFDAPCPLPELDCDRIILLQYFADIALICLVLAGGDVIVVREEPQHGQEKIEIVGSVDAGILAAAWAPGEELLAIVSRTDTLILMSRDFEPIKEVPLTVEDLQASKHVSIGWGKKETQFQGKRAKAMRDPTIPETVDEGKLSPFDDGRCTVSWRGDGAYFAVNSVLGDRRVVRIFTRETILDGVSELVDGFEGSLSWRPAGNLIAGIQRLEDHIDVIFFERNGLRHGQFSLRPSKKDMADSASLIGLAWNLDSTVLAVSFQDRVQLWTMGNYHYYLKQEIMINMAESPPRHPIFRWHPEKPLRCSIGGSVFLLDLDFELAVSRGSTSRPNDHGIVAVIDGRILKVTPFRYATVPPPMAFCEISTEESILDCVVSSRGQSLAIRTTSYTEIYDWPSYSTPQMTLRSREKAIIEPSKCSGYKTALRPQGEPWQNSLQLGPTEGEYQRDFQRFSCSRKGELVSIMDQNTIARSCTSFVVTDEYLLFTTSQHILKSVRLDDMRIPGDNSENAEECRTIERGAKLVSVVPSTYAVILQMPRGNLETIYPRALVLGGIRRHIDESDYKSAFLACQTHQVEMNILHEYKQGRFLANVALFIEQVKKPSRLNLFLSKLKESSDRTPDGTSRSRINDICEAFLAALKDKTATYLQTIITAHVCRRPPDLEAGLQLVADLHKMNSGQAEVAIEHLCFLTDTNRLYDTALSLYDVQLALLVAQQAQRDPREYLPFLQTLHDAPQLRRQFMIDDHLRNYSKAITHLYTLQEHDAVRDYAVKHNLYTIATNLYATDPSRLAEIIWAQAAHLASLSEHLAAAQAYHSISDYTSAFPLYALAHSWRESLTCALLIPLATPQLQALALSLAEAQSSVLRNYAAAATIHADFLSDIPTAASLFCKGAHFSDATLLLSRHSSPPSAIAMIIDPLLRAKVGELTALLADCSSQLHAQVPRIAELRVKKAADPLAFFGGDPSTLSASGDVPDNVSIAPTDASTAGGQTLFTRYSSASRATSKTRRREERKRARGKKGSVYEEEYLVNSVRRCVERVNAVHGEAGRVVDACVVRGMRDLGQMLDERMQELAELCGKSVGEVWEGGGKKQTEQSLEDSERPSGADGVLWDSVQSTDVKVPPEVKEWKGGT